MKTNETGILKGELINTKFETHNAFALLIHLSISWDSEQTINPKCSKTTW